MKKKKAVNLKHAVLMLLFGTAVCFSSAILNTVSSSAVERPVKINGPTTVASYFSTTDGATFTTNTDTPFYVENQRNGILVESKVKGAVVYDNLVDVTNLTKEYPLFEIQITPQKMGESEMNQLIVRLEDSENPNEYMNISLWRYSWGYNVDDKVTGITVKTNTIDEYKGLYYDEQNGQVSAAISPSKAGVKYGTFVFAPFAGAKGGSSSSAKVYYDYANCDLYTDNCYLDQSKLAEKNLCDEDGKVLVLDMDNHTHMGIEKNSLFKGFSSGKVRISFIVNDILSGFDTARYMILSIDNQNFNGTLLDDVTPPTLTVDTLGYGDELPTAQVGKFYKFFESCAVDKMYGELSVKNVVKKDGEKIYSSQNGFIPEAEGEYTVQYVAADGNRNETVVEYKILAKYVVDEIVGTVVKTKNCLDITNADLKNKNGNFGISLYYSVQLPKMVGSGGSGDVLVDVFVTYNGHRQKIENDNFTPNKKGLYTLSYVLTDYLGNQKVYDYTLECTYSDTPLLHQPILPEYMSLDRPYRLPKLESEYYTLWQQKVKTYDCITVYKQDRETVICQFAGNEEAIYTPVSAHGETVFIEYSSAKDGNSNATKYGAEVKLLPSEKLSDRFVCDDGVILDEQKLAVGFKYSDDGQWAEYVNPLSIVDGTSVKFIVDTDNNDFDEAIIRFTDYCDVNNYIDIHFAKNPDENAQTSFIYVDGSGRKEINGSFYGKGGEDFSVSVKQDGSVYNSAGQALFTPFGFGGFVSDYVLLSCSASGIKGDSEIVLKQIRNQILSVADEDDDEDDEDCINPLFSLKGEMQTSGTLGSVIEICPALASDVYDVKTSIQVSVEFNNQTIYEYFDGFGVFNGAEILAKDYGSYTVMYDVKDFSGNRVNRKFVVEIKDDIAPTLNVESKVRQRYKVGDKISLPKIKALDNVDSNVSVYYIVIDPMNEFDLLKINQTYKFEKAGRYILKFYCQDKTYNSVFSDDYEIVVNE